MLDNKFFITLVGLAVAVFAIANINTAGAVTESFGMVPSFRAVPGCNATSSICYGSTKELFTPEGAMIAPGQNGWGGDRAGARTNGRDAMYNRANPSQGYVGTVATNKYGRGLPSNQMMTGEGYQKPMNSMNKPVSKYGAEFYGQMIAPPSQHKRRANNPKAMMEAFESPVGDMINGSMDQAQRIVGERLIISNRTSRLRSQGDPIRGDLPIVPNRSGWFQVSVRPEVDLQGGALNVIAGVANAQGRAVSDMLVRDSGNTTSAVGGVVVNPNNIQVTTAPVL